MCKNMVAISHFWDLPISEGLQQFCEFPVAEHCLEDQIQTSDFFHLLIKSFFWKNKQRL